MFVRILSAIQGKYKNVKKKKKILTIYTVTIHGHNGFALAVFVTRVLTFTLTTRS